jgi:hypothetical protein
MPTVFRDGDILTGPALTAALSQATADATSSVAGVTSVNAQTGAVVLGFGDIIGALGYTPYSATNPTSYQTADQVAAAVPIPANATPLVDGVGAPGTSVQYARQDHVHPNPAPSVTTISYAATITLDLSIQFYRIAPLTGAVTFANPVNLSAGSFGSFTIVQDGTGSRLATWGTNWKFVGGSKTLSTAASSVDRVDWEYDATTLMANLLKAFA